MDDITLIVQRKKVTTTTDGGSDIVFETSENHAVQAAKIFLIPKEKNLEITVRILDD